MTHDEIIANLPREAKELTNIADRMSDEQLRQRRVDGHWSVKEVTGHLRDVAERYAERMHRIANEDKPQLAGFNQDEVMAAGNYNTRPIEPLIEEIAQRNEAMADFLRGLTEEGWQQVGVHAERGPQTIEQIAEAYVVHAQVHLDDLWERVGSC